MKKSANHRLRIEVGRLAGGMALLALCAVVASLLFAPTAQAGTIGAVTSIGGTGLGTAYVPAIVNVLEGNDNQPDPQSIDLNQLVVVKRFDHDGYIDIQFSVFASNPAGTTEYRVFESVDNNTGADWSGYTTVLGFGVAGNFQQSASGDDLDFDAPGYDLAPSSSAFANVALGEDLLFFSGGVHSSGSEVYEFRIDVPDGIQTFTLRQYPRLVPEPSTLALAFGALAAIALVWRRRRAG